MKTNCQDQISECWKRVITLNCKSGVKPLFLWLAFNLSPQSSGLELNLTLWVSCSFIDNDHLDFENILVSVKYEFEISELSFWVCLICWLALEIHNESISGFWMERVRKNVFQWKLFTVKGALLLDLMFFTWLFYWGRCKNLRDR